MWNLYWSKFTNIYNRLWYTVSIKMLCEGSWWTYGFSKSSSIVGIFVLQASVVRILSNTSSEERTKWERVWIYNIKDRKMENTELPYYLSRYLTTVALYVLYNGGSHFITHSHELQRVVDVGVTKTWKVTYVDLQIIFVFLFLFVPV